MPTPADGAYTRTCPLCEAMCGVRVHIQGGRVARVRTNLDDVWSRGCMCPKGAALGSLHHDPDRVRAPLVRERVRRGVPAEHGGICNNVLAPGQLVDRPSGNAAMNGIPVRTSLA